MKAHISSNASFSSVSFCIFLLIIFFTFMLMISCSENPAIAEPQSKQYFNSSLLSYGDYIHSSIPAFGLDNNPINAQQKRALIYWYNITPSDVRVYDILGSDTNGSPQKANVTVLDIVFDPSRNGIYNNEISQDLKTNWGGLFKRLPDSTITKFEKKNLVMKIWLKISDASEDALLNIDIGKISEDIFPNNRFDTEDKNSNDLLDNGEDTGIDGIFDLEEPNYQNNSDPSNDNFSYSSGVYENVNGLENNRISHETGRTLDSEDLNRNFVLDQSNDYFSYQVPLDTNEIVRTKITEFGNNGWIQVKIPIDLPDIIVGSPYKSGVETIRLWITNADRQVHIRIAQIKFEEI